MGEISESAGDMGAPQALAATTLTPIPGQNPLNPGQLPCKEVKAAGGNGHFEKRTFRNRGRANLRVFLAHKKLYRRALGGGIYPRLALPKPAFCEDFPYSRLWD